MKTVVVTMVKNEEVFLESSVRYWLTFADQVIVFDHYSQDGTAPILYDLVAELGDQLILFNNYYSTGVELQQATVTNAMVDAAFHQYDADLVIPLDADEYPYLTEGGSLREFFYSLPQNACYTAYWMLFAPPAEGIDLSLFVPFSFTRKKCVPTTRWGKSIITRECYFRDKPMLSVGNHLLLDPESGTALPTIEVSPKLYYAHYVCRGKEHYTAKNFLGWLAVFSSITWTPGTALQYQLACEQLVDTNGEVSSEVVDWYSLSVNGLTGESMEDIQKSIKTIDPYTIYPQIQIKHTQKHIQNKKPIILLFESAIQLAEQHREVSKSEKQRMDSIEKANAEIQSLQLELVQLRQQITAVNNQLSIKNAKLAEIQIALGGMVTSHSWKLTAPLRFLRSKITHFKAMLKRLCK